VGAFGAPYKDRGMSGRTLVRTRLGSQIAEALCYPVTILRAGAGYGKSIALNDAIDALGINAVRYSPTSQSGSLAAFVRGLTNALQSVAPAARLSFTGAWERATGSPSPAEHLARWLHAHLGGSEATIVLDQLHNVASLPDVEIFLTRLVELNPVPTRWVLALREDIDLPVPRWLAEGTIGVPIDTESLKFTEEEIAALAQEFGKSISAANARTLYDRTQGWPMGVSFAMRDREAGADTYETLARCAFDDRTERERRFLVNSCVLPDLDAHLCRAAGLEDAADVIASIGSDAAFIFADASAIRCYHDKFAAFLLRELEAQGPDVVNATLVKACRALEEVDRVADALRLAACHQMRSEIARQLDRYGLEMLQSGDEDAVQAALAVLGIPNDSWSGETLALKAVFESRAGRFDTSDAWLGLALDRTSDRIRRAEVAYCCASEMLVRRRSEALPLLERYAEDNALPLRLRVSILSALASAQMQEGHQLKATSSIWYAIGLAEQLNDASIVVPLTVRAAYVALYSGSSQHAKAFALRGAALAEETGQFAMAVSACSTLYALAADEDDIEECLTYLRRLSDNAAKAGNPHMQQYGLMAMYELEVERGDAERVSRIWRSLHIFDVHYEAQDSADTILPSRALELAAEGLFSEAYRLLLPSALQSSDPDREALRWAEVALYAAAAGKIVEAKSALLKMRRAFGTNDDNTVRAYRAKVLAALTLSLLGRKRGAASFLDFLVESAPSDRSRSLCNVVKVLVNLDGRQTVRDDVDRAMQDLWRHDAGGFAKAFSQIPAFRLTPRITVIDNRLLRSGSQPEIVDEVDAALNALLSRLDRADPLTAEHSRAVSSWCARLARRLGMSAEEIVLASRSGLVHDIGKLQTPTEILNAPRSLSADEWEIMRAHALIGEGIVLEIPTLRHLSVAVRSHHERIDGKGYPDGKRGLRIPAMARLVAVADSFNAMIGRRAYRKPMPPPIALMELERHRGTQFDPEIVDAMVDVVAGPAERHMPKEPWPRLC
jgi:HD-GYP domain-containing protein (c-di-GMP phosphodiesterase class II)/ATP/maltotriose-dependent transcriptional regulator MalT